MKRLAFFLMTCLLFFPAFQGCGLETLFTGGLDQIAPPQPPEIKPSTRVKGIASQLASAEIALRTTANANVAAGLADSSGAFEIELPLGTDFNNLIAEATSGGVVYKGLIPLVKQGEVTDIGTLDAQSTSTTLIIEALLSTRGLQIVNYPTQALTILLQRVQESSAPEVARFRDMVKKLLDAAAQQQGGLPIFRSVSYLPPVGTQPAIVEQSAISPNALGNGVDYCSPGEGMPEGCTEGVEKDSLPFDAALAATFPTLSLPRCTFGEKIRVVFTARLSQDAKDGNCSSIDQFRSAKRHGGMACEQCKVYFTGGVHRDSVITDPRVMNMLTNWEPNKLQMYDDGTNGDLIANDGIWTLVMLLDAPKKIGQSCQQRSDCPNLHLCHNNECMATLRIGYKYTFGLFSDVWGGTEEFPGNQRLLEIFDQNGDGFVARHDNFADETSNKDRVNTLQRRGVTGTICFQQPPADACGLPDPRRNHPDCGCKEDQDGDGIPDTRERSWDFTNNCQPDGFRVYANAQPEVVSCE
jgi:hypothetical protein